MTDQQRIENLKDRWIEIEKHESGVWIVIDTRYNTSQPCFESLEEALKYGERTVGLI